MKKIEERLRKFAKDRDWEQFHSPKNLSMALCKESAELMEIFQWKTEVESYNPDPETLTKIEHELADIFSYLIRMSDVLGIDLIKVTNEKITLNGEKYPIEKAKGNAKKYTEF
jgi:NTP pyrophosphatase (non-canonical NTP hydrolase)